MKISAYLITILIFSFANLNAGKTLLIDDFETGRLENRLGGEARSWEAEQINDREWLNISFKKDRRKGRDTRVLKLEYKVTEETFNGYYSRLMGIDGRLYSGLSFYVRGGEDYPDRFKVEIKNSREESGGFYVTDLEKSWKKVKIPFKSFRGISSFSELDELIIMFEGSVLGNDAGTIYLDQVQLYASESLTVPFRGEEKEVVPSRQTVKDILDYNDDQFLDCLSRVTFNYFWENAHPVTGFIRDRSREDTPSSIAATGFGLASICIADERGWIETGRARQRVLKTVKAMRDLAERHQGYYYHFINMEDGARAWESELSSIDTALFLGGAITAGQYYGGEIKEIVREIYEKVNWPFMMDAETETLYMGWDPEGGFEDYLRWDTYSEHTILYLLGLGSPTYPLPSESWHAFRRPVKKYEGVKYIYCRGESLFVYHFSHAFFDFREKHDRYADYWINSLKATRVNRLFAKNQSHRYRTYEECFWGLSAGDGPDGYRAFGATHFTHNGTVAPYSVGASVPFIPENSIETLRRMIALYGYRIWDPEFGFVSTFNLDRNWFASDQIGIDLGIMLLMIENYRTGLIWEYFMKSPFAQKAMERAGFKDGTKKDPAPFLLKEDLLEYDVKTYRAARVDSAEEISEENFTYINIPEGIEYGFVSSPRDLSAEFALAYNQQWLFLQVNVTDDIIITDKPPRLLYEDDSVELFISPDGILHWGRRDHFQIGFAPSGPDGEPIKYSFFQDEDPGDKISVESEIFDGGYQINAAISWDYLGIVPEEGKRVGMSVAVHDRDYIDEDRGTKINWSFEEGPTGIMLGEMILD